MIYIMINSSFYLFFKSGVTLFYGTQLLLKKISFVQIYIKRKRDFKNYVYVVHIYHINIATEST